MYNKILIVILVLVLYVNLEATTYYVNGEKGNDQKAEFDGLTPETAFKTIGKAVSSASFDNDIIVEGKGKKEQIVYNETVLIPSQLSFLKLTGKNSPVIDGMKKLSAGVIIESDGTIISNFTIKNFVDVPNSKFNIQGGVGILITPTLAKVKAIDNKIENCNYGIYISESQLCEVSNNEIKNCESNLPEKNSGAGIMIWSENGFLQKNLIVNNKISGCNYGIRVGSSKNSMDAEFTKIQKNSIIENQIGLSLENLIGIFGVDNNTFTKNNSALVIKGTSIDITIENNIFDGSKSGAEITTDESYPGDLLWGMWKDQGNKFSIPTYSTVDKGLLNISSVNGKRIVTNKVIEAIKNENIEIKTLDATK